MNDLFQLNNESDKIYTHVSSMALEWMAGYDSRQLTTATGMFNNYHSFKVQTMPMGWIFSYGPFGPLAS